MSAPLTYGIAAKAKHADCAAFFLNWVATNKRARKIDVEVGGSHPVGRPTLYDARAEAAARSPRRRSRPAAVIAKDNGAMDFIANATGAIYAQSVDARGAEARSPGSRQPQERADEGPGRLRAAGEAEASAGSR